MQVKVIGRHMNVTDPTREYAEEKFGRLSKIYDAEPIVAEVVLDVRKNRSRPDRFTAEVTIWLKGHVVRA
jgi:putative sigma-54 modulation protein